MFSVWEKDAKDESGFVGYCYLDLFPRGKLLQSMIGVLDTPHPEANRQNRNTRTPPCGLYFLATRKETAPVATP